MPRLPQCPRCGDNLSELVELPREFVIHAGDDKFITHVCKVCFTTVTHPPGAVPSWDEREPDAKLEVREPTFNEKLAQKAAEKRRAKLRDRFAMAAVPALIREAEEPDATQGRIRLAKFVSEVAYQIADAMLAAREAKPKDRGEDG